MFCFILPLTVPGSKIFIYILIICMQQSRIAMLLKKNWGVILYMEGFADLVSLYYDCYLLCQSCLMQCFPKSR